MPHADTGIYLDVAATAPLLPEVYQGMEPWLTEQFHNPASLHPQGLAARQALALARERCATALGCHNEELTFTSGATEANNTLLKGLLHQGDHLIVGQAEHASVLDVAHYLEASCGIQVTFLQPDSDGLYSRESLENALRPNTRLVCLMLANNETGVRQPLHALGSLCQEKEIPFHSDLVQAVGKTPLHLHSLPISSASFSAHKFGGPRGFGLLYCKAGSPQPRPLLHGGSQEFGRRSGTVSVASAVGCAIALEAITPAALETLQDTTTHWLNLWNIYLHNVGPHAGCVNTPLNKDYHVGGVINLSLPPLSGDQWVNQLGLRGIYIASGSACHEAQLSPSHVLLASGRSPQLSSSALRFSFNHHTDASQLTHVFEVVTQLHQRHLKRKHS